ncbi:MAG: hypothetical protein SGBAC_009107 [Bacillariaceae sp.]
MDNFSEDHEQDGRSSPRPHSRKKGLAIVLVGMILVSLFVSSDRTTNSMKRILSTEQKYSDVNATYHATVASLKQSHSNTTRIRISKKYQRNTTETLGDKSLNSNNPLTSPNLTETKLKRNSEQAYSGSTITTETSDRAVSIVVQLSGELGNQVHKIANGLCVQDHVEKELGFPTKLVLRHQKHGKWQHAMEWTKEAFPNTRPFDFEAGNTEEFDSIHRLQERWMDQLIGENKLDLTSLSDPSLMKELSCAESNCYVDILNLLNQTWDLEGRPEIPQDAKISLPHIYINTFVGHHCLDRMYERYREFFQLDEEAICKQVPDPDESVLHLRNFLVEMPKRGKKLGFEQLGPNVTASRIFKDYQPGDKVAIVSRFPDKIEEFINALKDQKGIQARYIEGQTGNQDFCFLLKAQKEMIGQRVSTFVSWAGILGNTKKVRLYSVDSLETRTRSVHFFNETFENEDLKQRIVYENYNVTHR